MNYRDYTRFMSLTPEVHKQEDGSLEYWFEENGTATTKKAAESCLEFAVDTALRIQRLF